MFRPLLLFLILSHFGYGQPCVSRLEGVVRSESKDILQGAVVRLSPVDKTATTDENGKFSFEGLCSQEYFLTIQHIGFQELTVTVQPGIAEFEMRQEARELRDVVIEGSQERRSQTQTAASLDQSELKALHGKPLGESLREIPGVSAIQTGPAIFKPVIHGLHSQRILILNNGIRQEGQQWGIEHAPEIDPYIASNIEVVKGAETVRYGSDAVGGVIIINPPPVHDVDEFGGEVNAGFMTNSRMLVFSSMLEGNLTASKKWSWRLQNSLKKAGDFQAPDYTLSNTGVQELNFSGGLGFRNERQGFELYLSSFNTEIGILRAAHTGNLNDLQQSIESTTPWYVAPFSYAINNPRQGINHHLLKAKAYFEVGEIGRINVLYGGQYNQRREYDIRRAGRSARPAVLLNLISQVLDLSLDHQRGDHSGSIGFNTTFKRNTNDTEQTGIIPLIPDYQHLSGAVFVFEKIKHNKTTLEAGLRYDYQYLQVLTFLNNATLVKPTFNFNFFSGSVGVSHLFNERLRFNTNIGLSTRPPHVSELYSEGLHHGTGSIEEGLMRVGGQLLTDQNSISKEQSTKVVTSLQYSAEKLSVDFSVHYNNINNYVFLRPYATRLTTRGYFGVFRFEQTDATLMGGDFSLVWNVSPRFKAHSKFSYTYAEDRRRNDVLIFIPPGQADQGLTYSLNQLGPLHNFFISVSAPIVFRQFRAPMVVQPRDIPQEVPTTIFDFSPPPDAYWLLNARVGGTLPVGKHNLDLSISGENLMNTSYRNYMNRLRYFADDTGRNIILRLSYAFYKH